MKSLYSIFIFFLILETALFSQSGNRRGNRDFPGGAKIIGKVIDANDNLPLEYSNIVLLSQNDSAQVTGTIADQDGNFVLEKIRPNDYLVKISFIGYKPSYLDNITIARGMNTLDIGTIKLVPTKFELESAVIIANKSPVEYHIDKKVINVSEQNTSISGSAVDVLENVPSVNVDIEGNVELRGSGSFTLLIDGRPTILDPNDALQQIPASSIENIEIVTNPSAKFDPEGVSGIINVIMKKNKNAGISGIINAHVGLDDKYGSDFLASYRSNGYSFYLGGDYRDSRYPRSGREERITFGENFDTYLNSIDNSNRGRDGYNLTWGGDFDFDDYNKMGLSFRYGDRTSSSNSSVEFSEFTQPATNNITYANLSRRERGGDRFSSSLNYKHIFEKGGHEIIADFDYRKRNGEEFTINEYFDQAGKLSSGRKNTEDGPSERFNAKIDYSLPVDDNSKFESGLRASIGKSTDDSKSFIRDASNLEYLFQGQFSNIVDYKRNIYSLYSLFNSKYDKFGYQVGIRGEYTDRLITLTKTSEDSKIQRWDYFPTIHTSYSFSRLVQIMASYTRRIDRPRGYYFEPFITWEDQNNVRRGNPDLKPEYINSFEIAYLTHVDEAIFSIESYYRERKNKIERVRLIYDTNVTLRTAENVGTDHTLGVEFMLNSDIIENWNLNFMGDLSNYRLKGFFNGRNFDRENFNWSLRLNNSIALLKSLKFELNGRYNGPRISAQGEYEGYFSADLAIRKDFWDRTMSLTLQIRDIFQTAKREGYTFGDGFQTYNFNEREAPVVMLNLTLNFNNFKEKRNRGGDSGDDMGEEEF